jgi:cullin 3
MNLWRDVVIHSNETKTRLLDTLLDLVLRERNVEVINRGLMRNLLKMLMDLGSSVYQKDFEDHFLEVSEYFYSCESEKFNESCDCEDYLKKVESCLNEERERVSHYLDSSSESKITSLVEKKMIENHRHILIHMNKSVLVNMLMDDKYEDLRRMYNLFCKVPSALTIVIDMMISFIRRYQ